MLAASILATPVTNAMAQNTSSSASAQSSALTSPSGPPIVFNYQHSARAGDYVYFNGVNLSGAVAIMAGYGPLTTVNSYLDQALTVQIPKSATGAIVVTLQNSAGKGPALYLNRAEPLNLDTTLISPGSLFRIMGHNLMASGYTPTVTVGGQPAPVDLTQSSPTLLVVRTPPVWPPGPITIATDNGNGSGAATLAQSVTLFNGTAADPFGLSTGWASAFMPLLSHFVTPTSPTPALPLRMIGDDTTDNTSALQAAINYAHSIGGGTVILPPGKYRLTAAVAMQSNVVIIGAGAQSTVIHYSGSFPVWSTGNDLVGMANIGFVTETASDPILWSQNTRSFLKGVSVSFGASNQIFMYGNTNFAMEDSSITQGAIGLNGEGAAFAYSCTGCVFSGNTFQYMTGGALFLLGAVDTYVGHNQIIRDGSVQNVLSPSNTYYTTHGIAIDFSSGLTLDSNTFSVVNGPIANYVRNDGEAILAEGGGGNRTESIGVIGSLNGTTLVDATQSVTLQNTTGVQRGFDIIMITGKGAGQKRQIVSLNNNTITIDRPWDILPSAGDTFATAISLEHVIVVDNSFKDWPIGTWIYQTTADDITIAGNSYSQGGGILVKPLASAPPSHNVVSNINIFNNTVANSNKLWPAYISLMATDFFQNKPLGLNAVGVVMNGNSITANLPNISAGEDVATFEGYANMMLWQNTDPFISPATPSVLDTVFQGNNCNNCGKSVLTGTNVAGSLYSGMAQGKIPMPLADAPVSQNAPLSVNSVIVN